MGVMGERGGSLNLGNALSFLEGGEYFALKREAEPPSYSETSRAGLI